MINRTKKYFRFQITHINGKHLNFKISKGVSKRNLREHIDYNLQLGIKINFNNPNGLKPNKVEVFYSHTNLGLTTVWGYIFTDSHSKAEETLSDFIFIKDNSEFKEVEQQKTTKQQPDHGK